MVTFNVSYLNNADTAYSCLGVSSEGNFQKEKIYNNSGTQEFSWTRQLCLKILLALAKFLFLVFEMFLSYN